MPGLGNLTGNERMAAVETLDAQGTAVNVLVVEDDALLAETYMAYLEHQGCRFTHVETGAEALDAIRRMEPDVVLLDLILPDINGLEVVRHITSNELPVSVIVITSQASVDVAIEAMRAGADDFLVKPAGSDRLIFTFSNVLERRRLRHAVATYEKSFAREQYCGFIGLSPPMQAVYSIIGNAAASKATVFITGESGTGKELCAEAIHRQGPRAEKPLVTVNCAAIPRDLLESEIFGHTRGAFTGAVRDREGAARRADGGTLFFDEICEMDLDLQAKLLRFIQTGTFEKVGGSRTESVDVRFLCATNRDPLAEVQARRFREDLYYRLHVIPVELPPLRERGGDVLLIARRLLRDMAAEEPKRFDSFSPAAEVIIGSYHWPGNVRQLLNVLRNVVVLNEGEVISPDMLPQMMTAANPSPVRGADSAPPPAPAGDHGGTASAGTGRIRPLWMTEKDVIEEAVELCDGNVLQAAARLGISDSTIYRKRRMWREMAS